MLKQLEALGQEAIEAAKRAGATAELQELRVQYLGKKGKFSEILKSLGKMSAEERPKVGASANEWKRKFEEALQARGDTLERVELEGRLQSEKIDVTLPGRRAYRGALHPITLAAREMVRVLSKVGFEVALGPEVETDYLCFESVNIPEHHPARDMQDTFYAGPGVVLRTHTTPVQMRTLLEQDPPIRILAPGAVYRSDYDATHSPMFHQIEGMWVDRGVRMSDLIGTLDHFSKGLFGSETQIRVRPSYFPFVEPGIEVDVGLKVPGGVRWLEIMGAGMVHPKLFEEAGYPAGEYTGFAFGIGIERVAMILYGVQDLRLFFQNDVRFLNQFDSIWGGV